jgi:hypothetical protein
MRTDAGQVRLGAREATLLSMPDKDVIAALALKPSSLPSGGRVKRIRVSLGTDHAGEEAVYVLVVLKDEDAKRARRWKNVEPLYAAIWKRVQEVAPSLWPYISFRLAAEDAKLARGGAGA